MFKLALLVLFLILNSAFLNAEDEESQDEWINFKQLHSKQYESAEEDNLKFSIWESNMKFINEHNERYEQGLETYTLEMNKFGDMTTKQFSSTLDGFDTGLMRVAFSRAGIYSFNDSVPYLEEINYVKMGSVTPVKNQGTCGSCYTFAAIGAIEHLFYSKNKKLIPFSEQHLLDCTGGFYGNNGCMGGFMDNCFKYIIRNGVEESKNYPYTGKKGICRQQQVKGSPFKVKGFTVVQRDDEKALTQAIYTKGPCSVGIDASLTSFQFYKKGVYNDQACSSKNLNHAVLIVGYGTDDLTGMDYYLVKNSWGTAWGDSGYIKMSRNNNNQCGISSVASFPIA